MKLSSEYSSLINLVFSSPNTFLLETNGESHYASTKGPARTLYVSSPSFRSNDSFPDNGLPSSLHKIGASFSWKNKGWKTKKHWNSSRIMSFVKHNMFKLLNNKEIDSITTIKTLIFPSFCLSSSAFAQNSECRIRNTAHFKRRMKYDLSVAFILGESTHRILPHHPIGCCYKKTSLSCCA